MGKENMGDVICRNARRVECIKQLPRAVLKSKTCACVDQDCCIALSQKRDIAGRRQRRVSIYARLGQNGGKGRVIHWAKDEICGQGEAAI